MPNQRTTSNYQVQIGEQVYEINAAELDALDLIGLGDERFHLMHGQQGYRAQLIDTSTNHKQLTIQLNGRRYHCTIEDELDRLVHDMGLEVAEVQTGQDIFAPMPGLVLDVLVEAGQRVQPGDQLLILEAMKMENVLKADGECLVKSIAVNTGDPVEKGQLLIEMES